MSYRASRSKTETNSYSSHVNIETEEDERFCIWMDYIEYIVKKRLDIMLYDLPDQPFRISFENGMDHGQMAETVINDYYKFF